MKLNLYSILLTRPYWYRNGEGEFVIGLTNTLKRFKLDRLRPCDGGYFLVYSWILDFGPVHIFKKFPESSMKERQKQFYKWMQDERRDS